MARMDVYDIVNENYVKNFITSLITGDTKENDLLNCVLLVNKNSVSKTYYYEIYRHVAKLTEDETLNLNIITPKDYMWDNFIWSYSNARADLITHFLHFRQTREWFNDFERLMCEVFM